MAQTYEFHPIANLFPMMSDDEQKVLAGDIKDNGLQSPIELFDGKIIDGRNRYRACEIAGTTPTYISPEINDAVAYVVSRNLHRRHLTVSQKAMVAARARDYYDERAKERMLAGKKDPEAALPQGKRAPQARDQAGAAMGVSGRTVDKATFALKNGVPELVKTVDDGKMDATKATKVAALPKNQQEMILEDARTNNWSLNQIVQEAKRLTAPRRKVARRAKEKSFTEMEADRGDRTEMSETDQMYKRVGETTRKLALLVEELTSLCKERRKISRRSEREPFAAVLRDLYRAASVLFVDMLERPGSGELRDITCILKALNLEFFKFSGDFPGVGDRDERDYDAFDREVRMMAGNLDHLIDHHLGGEVLEQDE